MTDITEVVVKVLQPGLDDLIEKGVKALKGAPDSSGQHQQDIITFRIAVEGLMRLSENDMVKAHFEAHDLKQSVRVPTHVPPS